MIGTWYVLENSEGESEITANSLPFLRGFSWALKPRTEMSEMSNIDILAVWCSVPVYSIKADNDYIPRVLLSLRRQETIALD